MSAPPAPRHPVWDNHFHLDPTGRNVDAVKEFHRAGGTHLMVVHKPYQAGGLRPPSTPHEAGGLRPPSTPHEAGGLRPPDEWRFNTTLAQHVEQMETTLQLADKVRREVPEVTVYVAVAPHPAEFTKHLEAGATMAEAEGVYRGALEHAQRLVREGRAVAMSEVGRPHWQPVAPDVWAKANELMTYAFELARDAGCAVQIHAETATPESFADLASYARKAGLPVERVVKHYSTPIVDTSVNHGLWPSVLIGKGSAEEAARGGTRFLMETDYMDDPRYPGAVLGPKTVPKRTKAMIDAGLLTEEQAWTVHAENPKRIYGVDVDL